MHERKWDWLLIPHILIVLWALLFVCAGLIPGGGRMAGALAPGNIAGLFVCIPLAVVSLIARARGRFGEKASVPILVLSVLNICIGAAVWVFFIMLLRSP